MYINGFDVVQNINANRLSKQSLYYDLQAKNTTIDVEIANVDSLIEEMKRLLAKKCPMTLNEVNLVATKYN